MGAVPTSSREEAVELTCEPPDHCSKVVRTSYALLRVKREAVSGTGGSVGGTEMCLFTEIYHLSSSISPAFLHSAPPVSQ